MNNTLSVKEALGKGWTIFKARPWFFVGTFVLYAIVQILMSMVQQHLPGFLSFILSLVVSTFLYMGLITVYLRAYENPQDPQYKDLWQPRHFWNYLIASVLVAVIVIIGLILIVVPGVIAALMLSLTGYLVMDKGMKPVAALKESVRLTKGNRVKLLLLGLAIFVLSLIGSIPLFLGLLVVAPVSMLAGVHAYRTLAHGVAGVMPSVPAPSEAGS